MGVFILVTSLLIIFFAGTFPFDFSFDRNSISSFDWRPLEYDPGFVDRGQNILFFMPLGFGLASIVRRQKFRFLWQLAIGTALGAAMSVLIECAQMFVSYRDPSMMDIWANTLGGFCGAVIYAVAGEIILQIAARGLMLLRPLAQPPFLAIATAAYAAFQLWAPLMVRNPGDLSVWDNTLPLIVGNELTADRGWSGSVSRILLADRAISEEQAQQLAGGSSAAQIFGDSLLSDYRIEGAGPYRDLAGNLPPLEWVSGPGNASAAISPDNWYKTPVAISPAIDRIKKSSEFTFAVTAITFSLDQRGPARLASVSGDTTHRNVQLGQEFDDLSIRVRMATRSMPDLYVKHVFKPHVPRQIVVTAADAQITIYIDGQNRGQVQITPEAKVIWRLYPRTGFRIRIERYGFRSYAAIYRLLVFIPFAALLAATLPLSKIREQTRILLGSAIVLLFAIAIEVTLGGIGNDGFQARNLLMSLVIGAGTLWLLLDRKKKDQRVA